EGLTLQEPRVADGRVGTAARVRSRGARRVTRRPTRRRVSGGRPADRTVAEFARSLQEPVHRTLMRLYAQLGRRGAALHQYQLCVGVLQRELGIEPEDETKRLYQEILARRPLLPTSSVPAASGGSGTFASVQRLPLVLARDAPLIGRDHEMARLRAAFAEALSVQGRVVAI